MTYLSDSLRKKAGATGKMLGDALLAGPTSSMMGAIVPGAGHAVSSISNTAGSLTGLLGEDAKKDIKERGHTALSLIPGVGAYRMGTVQRAVADEGGKRGRQQLLHEILGGGGGLLAGALGGGALGAGIGYATGSDYLPGPQGLGNMTEDRAMRALLGAGIGAGLGIAVPEMTAALMALVKRTRTKKEQAEHEEENLALNYLPGVASYNKYKRTGHGYKRYFGDKEDQRELNKKAEDTMYLREALMRKVAANSGIDTKEEFEELFGEGENFYAEPYPFEGDDLAAKIKNRLLKRTATTSLSDTGEVYDKDFVSPTAAGYGAAAGGGALAGAGLGAGTAALTGGSKTTGALVGGGIGAIAAPLALLAAHRSGALDKLASERGFQKQAFDPKSLWDKILGRKKQTGKAQPTMAAGGAAPAIKAGQGMKQQPQSKPAPKPQKVDFSDKTTAATGRKMLLQD